MNISKKLERVLDNYIKQNEKLTSEYTKLKNKRAIYEELIEILRGNYDEILNNQNLVLIFLNSIYENSTYSDELQGIISSSTPEQAIREFILRIIKDYEELEQEIEYIELELSDNEELRQSAHRVKSSLKYNKPIVDSDKDISNIKRILKKLESSGEISPNDEILYINEVEQHNDIISFKTGLPDEQIYAEIIYEEIPNIVKGGFQIYDTIEVHPSVQNKLNDYALEIIESISECNEEQIIELLQSYKNYNLETNEYNYILLKILDKYTEELLTLYKILLDKTIYRDKESRIEVIKDYYDILNKYLVIQNYYNSEVEYIPEEDNIQTNNIDYKQEKRFIYCHSNTNMEKARLISDMSDIPYEYYATVYDLLNRFKNGTIGTKEFKALTNHKKYKGYLELRYDQVRIILKHIKDNIYVILGVFAKKSDNDITMYGRIINRMLPDVNTDGKLSTQLKQSEHTEEELEKIVKTKGRKGTR